MTHANGSEDLSDVSPHNNHGGKISRASNPAKRVFTRDGNAFDENKMWMHCFGCGVPLYAREHVWCIKCDPEQRKHLVGCINERM